MKYDFSQINAAFNAVSRLNSMSISNEVTSRKVESALTRLNEITLSPEAISSICGASTMVLNRLSDISIPSNVAFQKSVLGLAAIVPKNFGKNISTISSFSTMDALKDISLSNISDIGASLATEKSVTPDELPEDDYVTIDEDSVQELNIPETIAVPVGNKRIRIKTDLFLTLLMTILFGLVGCIQTAYYEEKSLAAEQEYQDTQLKLEEERNQILRNRLESIDLSTSSQSDSIETLIDAIDTLTESLQSSAPDSQENDSTLYPDQENQSNNPE